MSPRDVLEAEVRSLAGEAIGAARLVSESVGPLVGSNVIHTLTEAARSLEAAIVLAKRLP
jgi:hypothetical protein